MADTIVMIHGMESGPWCWENYRRWLRATGCACVIPALPYHENFSYGVPDRRLGTTGLGDYTRALEHEIANLSHKPILLGHSLGGLLAQILGARGMARALILLAPAAPAGIIGIRPSVIRGFSSIFFQWGWWRKPVRQTFSEMVYSTLHLVPREQRKRLYGQCVHESGKVVFEVGCWPFDASRASRVDASRVKCPVLVIAGGKDRVTPPTVVRRVARMYRDVSSYKEFPGHGHWMVGEPGWEEVAAYIRQWITTLG